MLIECPECRLQVSDKALLCPHCGYPMKPDVIEKKVRKKNRRRRLPNGFGQISEIKGKNLRKPFRAMVPAGKTSTGRPISKLLKPEAYFATYNDAYVALVEYNKNPYDFDSDITVSELYMRWSTQHYARVSISTKNVLVSAWSYCSSLYDMKVKKLRIRHIKGCIESKTAIVKGKEKELTPAIRTRIKSLFSMMLDYAMEYEIVDKNYARSFDAPKEIKKEEEKNKKDHISFTDNEMKILWDNLDNYDYVDMILIQCYSGWRPKELCLLELKNIDLREWSFIGGMKTEAGENRKVPIHSKIRPLVEKRYKEAQKLGSIYLFNCVESVNKKTGIKMSYSKYKYRFDKVVTNLNLNAEHRPHDARKQFSTMAKRYKVDEYAIKYMIGHAIEDITEKIYTDRDFEWLQEEIEKIK